MEGQIERPVAVSPTNALFDRFLSSKDTLRVYDGENLVFASAEARLTPLLLYLRRFTGRHHGVTIMDRVTGNAAALLCVKAACARAYSELGSVTAAATLDAHGVRHFFKRTVEGIHGRDGQEMCPMERMSLHKSPDEFYALLTSGSGPQPTRPRP